jgi:mannosylfructose-6-phosphate phosphatase
MTTPDPMPVPRKTERHYLLAVDLDGAMLDDDDANRRLAVWWNACPNVPYLVYTSGMFYDSVVNAVWQHGLPEPAAIVGGVGTEIRLYPGGKPFIQWQSRWWSSWQMDHVRQLLDGQSALRLQPAECQSEFKRSYFVRDAAPNWLQETRRLLRECELEAELLYSSNRDLDIVPTGANKGTAVEFLARHWKVPRHRVMVAGDCENAISMYLRGYRGIISAGAQPELRSLSGSNNFRSPLALAEAVIDGVRFWMNGDPPHDAGSPFPAREAAIGCSLALRTSQP